MTKRVLLLICIVFIFSSCNDDSKSTTTNDTSQKIDTSIKFEAIKLNNEATKTYSSAFYDYNKDGYLDCFFSHHGKLVVYPNKGGKLLSKYKAITKGKDTHGVSIFDLNYDQQADVSISIGSKKGKAAGPGNEYFTFRNNKFIKIPASPEVTDSAGRGRSILPIDIYEQKYGIALLNYIDNESNPLNVIYQNIGKKKYKSLNYFNKTLATHFIQCSLSFKEKKSIIFQRGGKSSGTINQIVHKKSLQQKHDLKTFIPNINAAIPFDFDNDGDFDLICSGHSTDKTMSTLALLKNNNNEFSNVSKKVGIHFTERINHIATGDLNNDGYTDFVIAAKSDSLLYVFMNNGYKNFTQVAIPKTKQFSKENKSAVSIADINNDGKLDIIEHTGIGPDVGDIICYYNQSDTNANNYISLKLKSSNKLNPDCLGTMIQISNSENKKLNEVFIGNEYLGHSLKPIHIGLGAAAELDLHFRNPKLNLDSIITNVPINKITELYFDAAQ